MSGYESRQASMSICANKHAFVRRGEGEGERGAKPALMNLSSRTFFVPGRSHVK